MLNNSGSGIVRGNENSLYKDIDDAKKNCTYLVYHGEAYHKTGRYAGKMKELRYHYNCVKNEPEVKQILIEADEPMLIAPVPNVYGLHGLTEDPGKQTPVAKVLTEDKEETLVDEES